MNTHILIPIEYILNIEKRFTEKAPLEYIKNELLKVGKQISLTKEDVQEKAEKTFPITEGSTFNSLLQIGYKQALKDLL